MINLAQADTIDERTINKKNLNIYRIQVTESFCVAQYCPANLLSWMLGLYAAPTITYEANHNDFRKIPTPVEGNKVPLIYYRT